MATVTVSGVVLDETGRKDSRDWKVFSPVYREGSGGEVVTMKRQAVRVVAGVFTAKLDPGVCVLENPDGQRYTVTIPDEDANLWDVIAAAVAFPPNTEAEALADAVTSYLDVNPPVADWDVLTSKPTVIAAGATQAAARDAIAAQAADADLTAIAALTPSESDVLQRKSGVWTNRTSAQLKTDLALTKGDVGLSNADNTSDANKPISTATQAALDAKIPAGFGVSRPNSPSIDGFVLTPSVVPYASGSDVNGHGRQTVFTGDWTVSVSVTIDGSGGTARWAIGGQYADIAPTAAASAVQTALQALSTVGSGSVTVTGGPGAVGGGTPYVVKYAAKYLAVGGLLPLTVDATNLTGGAHSATLVWTNNWGNDTGHLFGEDSYTVTGGGATDGNGIGIMYGALMEANQCGGGTIGTIVALMGEAAFYGANATGPVETMISLNAAGPHYKGTAVPGSCTATNVYGLKVAGCQGPYVFTDGVTTNGSPVITSASSAFDPNILIGKCVTGPGIPAGAYITTLTTTSITLSANCTASASGVTVTIKGTLNSTTAYTAYFGPGSVGINGQTTITPWKDDVPLKLVGLFGGSSDLLELWSGPNKMIHFGKFGTVSMANALTTFEGQSPWQMTMGASTIASVAHPGISFGAPYNAAIISPASGVVAIAAGLQLGVGYASQPAGSRLWSGSGAPNISASVAGDFYFRTDTPSTANQRIYVATAANTWTGIV